MPVRNDNPPLPPQHAVRALPAQRGDSLVQSSPQLKLWQAWRVGFGAWVLMEVFCMWKGLDSDTSRQRQTPGLESALSTAPVSCRGLRLRALLRVAPAHAALLALAPSCLLGQLLVNND